MKVVNVGREFGRRLVNRDKKQGDGKQTAIEFRKLFLSELDNASFWGREVKPVVELDFSGVLVLAPSFANEAFAYFVVYAREPRDVLKAIIFSNLSDVKREIIELEVDSAGRTKV